MKHFARILACTDFSESGNRAIEAAIRLSQDEESVLMLAHVVDALPVPNPMYAHYYPSDGWGPESHSQAEAEARQALDALVPEEVKRGQRRIEVFVGHGQAVDEVLRLADENQVELIVVGTHGLSGLRHLLVGSVAERIVVRASCSVLLVR